MVLSPLFSYTIYFHQQALSVYVVCLILLASFFLLHLSNIYTHVYPFPPPLTPLPSLSSAWPGSLVSGGCWSICRTPRSLRLRCSTETCGATRLSRPSYLNTCSSGRCRSCIHVYIHVYIHVCTCIGIFMSVYIAYYMCMQALRHSHQ